MSAEDRRWEGVQVLGGSEGYLPSREIPFLKKALPDGSGA